ncbi:MAG: hypothetical protein ACYDHU_12335 [Acidimicrobiales bacterium]
MATTVALAVAAVGLGSLAGVIPASVASANPQLGSCTTTRGVVVVVDFAPWGGTIERGCGGTASSGLAALRDAGFTPTGTSEYGTAFVCRVNGDPASTSCTATPPANAYWALWIADPGRTAWTYSNEGAASICPAPGSVDAWTFGANRAQPAFAPSQVRATTVSTAGSSSTSTCGTSSTPSDPNGTTGGTSSGGRVPQGTSPVTTVPTTSPTTAPTGTTSGAATPNGATTPKGATTSNATSGRSGTTSGTASVPATTVPDAPASTGGRSSKSPATPAARTTGSSNRSPKIISASPSRGSGGRGQGGGPPVSFLLGVAVLAVAVAGAVLIARRRRQHLET